jgi:hypothetical protein
MVRVGSAQAPHNCNCMQQHTNTAPAHPPTPCAACVACVLLLLLLLLLCSCHQAKHHPDLIMCMKQPGIGGWGPQLTVSCRSWNTTSTLCPPPHHACQQQPPDVPRCWSLRSLAHNAHTAIGRLCEKCDGKCPICDSYVRPATLVRVCDECNYGSYEGRCVICGGTGVSDAYYCKECTLQEKDVSMLGCGRRRARTACSSAGGHRRVKTLMLTEWLTALWCRVQRDGCPKIINLGSAKTGGCVGLGVCTEQTVAAGSR